MADTPPRPSFVAFYPSDWKGGTAHLSPMLEWTYLQICLHNWDKGEALPKHHQAGVLGRNPDWEEAVKTLAEMDKIALTATGALFVPRAFIEYRRSAAALEKKRTAGRAGADKRWKKKEKNGDAMPDDGRNGDMVFSVPPDLWADFREHRRKLKHPMTERAEKGILKRLERFQTEGHDPVEVLEQSIRKGWSDVWPIKGDGNGNGPGDGRGLFNAAKG